MHRATPLGTSFRAYVSGGARSAIHDVEDKFGMQLTKANFMKNETRSNIEAPQNYGFTSVVADAIKNKLGNVVDGPEAIMSFIGGNRSFPMAGAMDDRRHRLINLAKDAVKGAVAMFGLKDWGQQFLNTADGMFMTGNTEKKMRFQLVDNKNNKQQPQSSGKDGSGKEIPPPTHFVSLSGVEFAYVLPLAADGGSGSSGSGGSTSGGQQQQSKGQKTLHKEESQTYVDMTKDAIQTKRGNGSMNVTDDISQTYHKDKSHDTRCDSNHVHIGWGDNKVWVNAEGIWSSKPIQLRNCDDKNGSSSGPPATGGPPPHTADSPLAIDSNANLSLAVTNPLAVMSGAEYARSIENPTPFSTTVYPLGLKFKDPLFLDANGYLTSSGGTGTGGIPEAPTDSTAYGRMNAAWVHVLAKNNDVLDGGVF